MKIPSPQSIIDGFTGAFKGTGDGLSAIGGALGTTASFFKAQGLSNTGYRMTNHTFTGAMAGLGISAMGLGAHALAPENVSSEGPVMSIVKGGLVGAGASLGIQAMGYFQPSLRTPFSSNLLSSATEGGFIGKTIGMAGKIAGSRVFGAAALGATGAVLLKSIISTNLTRPNN